jgi:hypothetical protein
MSRLHFGGNPPASAEAFIEIDETDDDDIYMSLQAEEDEVETRKGNEDVQMIATDEEPDVTEMENKAGSIFHLSNILSECSFKDSTAKKIFCARQHPSTIQAKGSI